MNYHDDHHHQFTLNHNYIYIKKNDIKLYFTPQRSRTLFYILPETKQKNDLTVIFILLFL